MTQPQPRPRLTPQFCFSSGTLRDFLRLSRAGIDDSIGQNLNALVTPSRADRPTLMPTVQGAGPLPVVAGEG
ncbi:hypothetical protein HYQ46_004899 [Verticillium longisporum]|nr:hypothetical protein HYQ46_004899 [Verticillium longisporum]